MDPQPPPRAPDPIITAIHQCPECESTNMGPVRVHEGSNKPARRGSVVQTCNKCRHSHFHTAPYVYDDAKHLLVRRQKQLANTPIPLESLHAPLRFLSDVVAADDIPPLLDPDASGRIDCANASCRNQQNQRRKASKKCIELKCKTCCVDAGRDARQEERYRDSCTAHNVSGSSGSRNAVHAAPLPTPDPVPDLPPIQSQSQRRGLPLPASQSTQPFAGQAQAAGKQKPRALALKNPISDMWKKQPPAAATTAVSSKVTRQCNDAILNSTADLVVYYKNATPALQLRVTSDNFPLFQLSSQPQLMASLSLTDKSWFDVYQQIEWKTMQPPTFFTVDKNHPTLIRLRPNLLETLTDCPGLEGYLSQHPKKRSGHALVSPPKKMARTNASSTAMPVRATPPPSEHAVIIIPDSPPPALLSLSTTDAVSTLPCSVSARSPLIVDGQRTWPDSFSVSEHREAWRQYDEIKDSRQTSIPAEFSNLFPGAKFTHTTVNHWRGFFLRAAPEIVDHFASFGRTPCGSWKAFKTAVSAHSKGEEWRPRNALPPPPVIKQEQDPIPLPVPAPAVPTLPSQNRPPASENGICDFCDEPFVVAPSSKSIQLRAELESTSHNAPTPANPSHRTAALPSQATRYCNQHRTDAELLPVARMHKWPEHINYAGLRDRVGHMDIVEALLELVRDPEASEFLNSHLLLLLKVISAKRLDSVFGELGYAVIAPAVLKAIRYSPTRFSLPSDFPLSDQHIIDYILIPECLVLLIAQDLDLDPDMAAATLTESTPFGQVYHSDHNDRKRCVDKMHSNFPVSPPFPSLPSPTLAPADFSLEPEPVPDPETLCEYCDEEMPSPRSESLIERGNQLRKRTWLDSHPGNKLHRAAPNANLIFSYCQQHLVETQDMPRARKEGWPTQPHFSSVFRRTLDLGKQLRIATRDFDSNRYVQSARDFYGNAVLSKSAMKAQLGSNRFAVCGTGYYGERGQQLIDLAIRFSFPAGYDFSALAPLTYDIVIREVLVPEAACRLIQQDLGVSEDCAAEILCASYSLGFALHPAPPSCEFYDRATQLVVTSHRRTAWALRVWEATNSGLGFEEWLQQQQEMEERIKVKVEPKDTMLTSSGKTVDLNAAVIDLTEDSD
ncbi:hypothetical protein GGX14DRAFT_570820 [Mycena pura]|uniref:Restriction of telomere capping protein 4 n=1 Tax=Mycena pura TaxID=153505 RepID=A0AAD6Y8K1_9AGAR|nr:hypothetical protein GGX14DRAFT_570820 [Mycena pura]